MCTSITALHRFEAEMRQPLSALRAPSRPVCSLSFPPLHGSLHGNPLLREKRLCSGVSEFGGACTVIWDLAWRPSARLKGSARGSKASARPCIGLCVQTATVKSERFWCWTPVFCRKKREGETELGFPLACWLPRRNSAKKTILSEPSLPAVSSRGSFSLLTRGY